ncbi:MAG: ABC transporter permease [Nitrospinota bacterium]
MTTQTVARNRKAPALQNPREGGGAKRLRRRGRFVQIGTVAGVLLLWEGIVRLFAIEPIFLPSVSLILKTFWNMVLDGTLPWNTMVTVLRILTGFFAAAVAGVGVGIVMGMSRTFQNICDPLIAALYPLPKITLIPLLIIWLGSGEAYKFVISAFTAFFPRVINTYVGLRQVDEGLVKAARDLGANERRIQLEVMMPAAIPSIFAGFRLGMGVAIILTVASEMIASQDGLGRVLVESGAILETEKVFAALLLMAILGIVVTKAQDWVDMRFAHWAFETRER